MACKLSSGEPGHTDITEAAFHFKANFEFTLSHFNSAVRAARPPGEEKPFEIATMSEPQKEDKGAQHNNKDTDELGSILDQLLQEFASAVETRLQKEVVPGIRYDIAAYIEKMLPDLEDRILRCLEDRLGMFKGTHPIYATLCSVLARRLADTITDEVETRIYYRTKHQLLDEFEDTFYRRVKERFEAEASAAATHEPSPHDAAQLVEPDSGCGNQTRKRSQSPSPAAERQVKQERLE
ncbi:hypothetical protein K466DRAFT_604468 [Polyporus arcularius HHB13444]|uniref:Uncharacterized protein n=1 Tax=Polyporus arcularius HHB13444 TaxID=1314778 RepID=A0A5C3NVH7_9APHY|nr:hypothetical protein K466DRAFT_604468 [Polyporus arcularius HHB13444]